MKRVHSEEGNTQRQEVHLGFSLIQGLTHVFSPLAGVQAHSLVQLINLKRIDRQGTKREGTRHVNQAGVGRRLKPLHKSLKRQRKRKSFEFLVLSISPTENILLNPVENIQFNVSCNLLPVRC